MQAVIRFQGKNHIVKPGQHLNVDRLSEAEGATLSLDQVQLVIDGDKTKVGAPTVAKKIVKAKVVRHHLGSKVRIAKYERRKRYRRVNGFRPAQTEIVIEEIV